MPKFKIICMVGFFFLAALAANAAAGNPGKVTIQGTVVENDWDEDDNVIGVAISTDEEYYVVQNSGKGRELLDHLGEDIEVKGTVTRDDDTGISTITVLSYRILE